MEREDFMQDSDIDILGITKMDTDSTSEVGNSEIENKKLTESVNSEIAAMVNSEAMQEMFR